MTLVDETIRELRSQRQPEGNVLVAIGVVGDKERVMDQVSNLGGTVRKDLPYGTLRVEVPVAALDRLCTLEQVESVEKERTARLHPEGN